MSFRSLLMNFVRKVVFPNSYSEEAYINYLKNKCNIEIGSNCKIYSPNQTYIDVQRPHMLHIGDYVKITRGVTILCHDYSRGVFCQMDDQYENVGECRKTEIGDNVFIGTNAIILMGTKIGSNSIVGAGAVVSGIFQDGVVIAGNPAKVICTIDEYYNKRKNKEDEEAKLYVHSWMKKYMCYPNEQQMTNAFSWLYLPRSVDTIAEYPELFDLSGVDKDKFLRKFLNSTPKYGSFEEFIKACQKENKSE